jgi:hypothetical protein
MSISLRFVHNAILLFAIPLLSVQQSHEAHADTPSARRWDAVKSHNNSCVQILLREHHRFEPSLPTFVITHGMGGTEATDRFHQLAAAIEEVLPQSNVILVDWSRDSRKTTSFLGLPSPWEVAKHIDPVAKHAAEVLQALGIDPTQTTFIGESFGNCVNAKIAEHLGRHGRILAFNPPNAAGGYKVPDLRTCADVAWSFQTFSIFDTQDSIAHVGFFLQTQANASDRDQHVAGISWLADQIVHGNTTWLLMQHEIAAAGDAEFEAVATVSGELLPEEHPNRIRAKVDHPDSRTSGQVITAAF